MARAQQSIGQDLIDQIARASIEHELWPMILERLAVATGSTGGQLVARNGENLLFNIIGDPEPEWVPLAAQLGALDPQINPRVHIGFKLPALVPFTDDDLVDRNERKRLPFYAEITSRFERTAICATKLIDEPELTVGFSVIRRPSQGEITGPQRQLFKTMLPYLRGSIVAHRLYEEHSLLSVASGLEAASTAVFICDEQGRIVALSRQAEELARVSPHLTLTKGQLKARVQKDQTLLLRAIALAAHSLRCNGTLQPSTIIFGGHAPDALLADIVSLPSTPYSLRCLPAVAVILRASQVRQDAPNILHSLFGLSKAEAAVTLRLLSGASPEEIALERHVALATVRVQIRTLYDKLGASRSGQLSARLSFMH